jgi:hypothetical protein
VPIRQPPEWIGLFEALVRIDVKFGLSYLANTEMIQHAVLSRRIPVRGIAPGDITHRMITDMLTSSMHVILSTSSEIRADYYGEALWRDVEVSWQEFLLYVEENLLPNYARRPPPSTRGRKTGKKTRRAEILAEFDQVSLSGKRGELTVIAKRLTKKFRNYKADTIRKMIQPLYRQKFPRLPKAY